MKIDSYHQHNGIMQITPDCHLSADVMITSLDITRFPSNGYLVYSLTQW